MAIKSDEAGTGTWAQGEEAAQGRALQVTYAFSDNSRTNTTHFLTHEPVPGKVATDAGVFTFSGSEQGGAAQFEPSEDFVAALRARGLRVYLREVLGCAIMQVPLTYMIDALDRLSNVEITGIVGMYMFGITADDITATLAKIPDASPMDVTSDHMMKRHQRGA